jgi:glycosyltransferase involved in cell wall biosynthesis
LVAGVELPVTVEELRAPISIVIPTYRRDRVLLDTIGHLLKLEPRAAEIVVVDQTPRHAAETELRLQQLDGDRSIRWLRLSRPSIPGAMNQGLLRASEEIVLFVDDDIVPDVRLAASHLLAHVDGGVGLVAGRVLQPWDAAIGRADELGFSSTRRGPVREFMGGNFSVKRALALALGGFDENFVHVAYRFEADFADRLLAIGRSILFEPMASIHHLKAPAGGTRAYGDHLRTVRPSHAVGEYYYLLRRWRSRYALRRLFGRPITAITTRHHLRRPWWIPVTLMAELLGFCWGVGLVLRGPRYLRSR